MKPTSKELERGWEKRKNHLCLQNHNLNAWREPTTFTCSSLPVRSEYPQGFHSARCSVVFSLRGKFRAEPWGLLLSGVQPPSRFSSPLSFVPRRLLWVYSRSLGGGHVVMTCSTSLRKDVCEVELL